MLYTTFTPVLNDTQKKVVHELKMFGTVTAENDEYDEIVKLNVQFVLPEKLVSCRC